MLITGTKKGEGMRVRIFETARAIAVNFSLCCFLFGSACASAESGSGHDPSDRKPGSVRSDTAGDPDIEAYLEHIRSNYQKDAGEHYVPEIAEQVGRCGVKYIGASDLKKLHIAKLIRASGSKPAVDEWATSLSPEEARLYMISVRFRIMEGYNVCRAVTPAAIMSPDDKKEWLTGQLDQLLNVPTEFIDSYLMLRPGIQDYPDLSVYRFVSKLATFQLDNGKRARLLDWANNDNEYTLEVGLKGNAKMKLKFVHILSSPEDGKIALLESVEVTDVDGTKRLNPLNLYTEIYAK